jgi:hypothetical protein
VVIAIRPLVSAAVFVNLKYKYIPAALSSLPELFPPNELLLPLHTEFIIITATTTSNTSKLRL